MRHVHDWPKFQDLTDVMPKPEEMTVAVHIGNERSQRANAVRIFHMVSTEGTRGEDRDFQAIRFHAAMIYVSLFRAEFLKAGFMVIDDTTAANIPSEVLAAVHERLLDDPLPTPEAIDLNKIIAAARQMEKTGIWDAASDV